MVPVSVFIYFQIFWMVHVLVYPQDAGQLKTFLGGSLSLPQFLTLVFPNFGAIPLGMMAGNALLRITPSARQTQAKTNGTTFAQSEEQLRKIATIAVPVTLAVGSIGALFPLP